MRIEQWFEAAGLYLGSEAFLLLPSESAVLVTATQDSNGWDLPDVHASERRPCELSKARQTSAGRSA